MTSAGNAYEPKIRYLSSSPYGDIVPDKIALESPLPLRLSDIDGTGKGGHRIGLTYGQYLETIKAFLSRDSYRLLIDAIKKKTGKMITLQDIDSLAIRTEKHGAMYHISSIDVITANDLNKFVVTAALSEAGKLYLENDFHWLNYLNNKFAFPYLPHVYHKGEIKYRTPQGSGDTMLISLGEWLEGYHEFHLSLDSKDQGQKIVVWDSDKGYRYLSGRQSYNLYRLASKILTLYYDIATFEQISLWHHAAGDFIARIEGEDIDLKLITVRRYEPMISFSTDEEGNKMAALLYFFVHLMIRMRMDRLDGTGDVAWADDFCPDAVMKGFYEALEIKEETGRPASIDRKEFLSSLKRFTRDDWKDMAHATLQTCPQPEADLPIIMRNLDNHIERLYAVIQSFQPDSTASSTSSINS
ncbi:MAG: hypothetical protein RDU59_09275 [Thermodesulfobacteriota bacterium]|nr:hypothetical protein [Thermodesulfobacteriota bacterium]